MNSLSSIARLANGWLQLKVPVPFSLKWVNSYVLPEASGWTVIDPGLRSPETEAFWEASLHEAGIAWERIGRIVLTHHHPDHYGLAGWFQQRTGAPVHLSPVGREWAQRMWGERETSSSELLAAFTAHGMPPERMDGMKEHLRNILGQVLPHPADIRPLPEPGGAFEMAGGVWTVIGGGGHAPGHTAFYRADRRWIICGDQVLPDITPNVGWMPGGDADPLASFLTSLRAMRPLEVELAFPGHRDPFSAFGRRIDEILAHHERRLEQMTALLAEAGPMTAYEMCDRLFGARVGNNSHQLRFAMAETLAHLEHLARAGHAFGREAAGPDGAVVHRYGARNGAEVRRP